MTRASDTARLLGAGGTLNGALSVDTINEKTSGSGVTIDSLNVKDGGIGGQQIGGRRNIVINGAMNVAQRSTSVTGLGDGDEGYVTVDRIRHSVTAGAGRFTSAQTAISDLPGFLNCLHLDCTTADTSIASGELLRLEYRIEGQDLQLLKKGTSSAEKVTVSFYMKTNKAFTFMCELNDSDNNRVNVQQFTTSTSFTRHVLTFNGDTSGALNDDSSVSLSVGIYLHAGNSFTGGTYSANTWQSRQSSDNMRAVGIGSFFDSTDNDIKITGLQVEVGSVATPFEHRSVGEELALCQRYYHRHVSDGSSQNMFGVGFIDGETAAAIQIHFPTTMRDQPSALETTGTAGDYAIRQRAGAAVTCNIVPAMSGDTTPNVAVISFGTAGSLTADSGCMGRAVNSGVHLSFTAEL